MDIRQLKFLGNADSRQKYDKKGLIFFQFDVLSFSVKEDGNSCHLPAWFIKHRRYHSLSYSTAYQINKAGNTLTLETEGNKEDTKLECLNMKSETNSTALFTVMSVTSW